MNTVRYRSDLTDTMPRPFTTLLDRFFNETVNARSRANTFMPLVDAFEDEKAFEIRLTLPGMKREEIAVDLQDGQLTVSGERKLEHKNQKYHLVESQYGAFKRTFQLPENVSINDIEASYTNGILAVRLPKDEQKVLKKRIEVKEAAKPETLEVQETAASENGHSKAAKATK